jgi:hypothetical protein
MQLPSTPEKHWYTDGLGTAATISLPLRYDDAGADAENMKSFRRSAVVNSSSKVGIRAAPPFAVRSTSHLPQRGKAPFCVSVDQRVVAEKNRPC